MTTSDLESNESRTRGGRNPLILLVGFALLGVALALLLFGGALFGQNAPAEAPVLEQVSAFPTSAIGPAEISPSGGRTDVLEVGDQAYDFTLNDLDGNPVSLADFRGRPVIINFWATWCAPCRIEMPELQAAYEKYQEEGLVILALDQDEPVEVAREYFYDEMGLTFTPLLDENSAVATTYSNFGTLPTTYFLNPEGTVTAIHRGPMTQSQIEGYLAQTIPEV